MCPRLYLVEMALGRRTQELTHSHGLTFTMECSHVGYQISNVVLIGLKLHSDMLLYLFDVGNNIQQSQVNLYYPQWANWLNNQLSMNIK